MSALLRKRTNRQISRSVRFVPIATERSAAKSHCLFDHLVGAAEQRKWDYRYIPDLDRIRCGRTSPRRKNRLLQLAGLVIVTNRAREIPTPRRVIDPPQAGLSAAKRKRARIDGRSLGNGTAFSTVAPSQRPVCDAHQSKVFGSGVPIMSPRARMHGRLTSSRLVSSDRSAAFC
jgi:hypothetical protein